MISIHLLLSIFLLYLAGHVHSLATIAATPKTSANQKALSEQPTSFPRTWVPMGSTLELDPSRPNQVYFLNNRYVTYGVGESNDWIVMDDACPHRLAPLSQGRIVNPETSDAILECSYHGWRFDRTGSCVRIPQVEDAVQQKAAQSPKCHATSYSTRVENDIVFFWPWEEDCLEFAADVWRQPEGMLKGLQPKGTYTRDLPYGWEVLVENIVDPSHVPFAHHGLQGKREDAIAVNMTMVDSVSPKGFSFTAGDRTMGQIRSIVGEFRAPYVIQYSGQFQDSGSPFDLTALLVPSKPGWSRITLLTGAKVKTEETDDDEQQQQKRKLLSAVFKLLPVWATHLLSNRFLDSDLAFLHFQELEIERGSTYFMPAEADRCIAAWRRWLSDYGIAYPGSPALSALPESVLFDRYSQHTVHCRHCREALEGIRSNRRLAVMGLVGSILLWQVVEPLAQAGAISCIGFIGVTTWLETFFRQGGFDHARND